MIKAIIFDVYGTLISTGTGSIDATTKILSINNRFDISPEFFYTRWKTYHKYHINTLEQFLNEEAIFRLDLKKLYDEFGIIGNADSDVRIMLETLGKRIAFPETKEVLDRLSLSVVTCIGSTTDTKPLLENLRNNKLKVNKIYTSEMLATYKPKAEFYESILRQLNILSSEALFVGDSLIDDVIGPESVGIETCWINRKKQINTKAKPGFEISDLRELYDIVSYLNKYTGFI